MDEHGLLLVHQSVGLQIIGGLASQQISPLLEQQSLGLGFRPFRLAFRKWSTNSIQSRAKSSIAIEWRGLYDHVLTGLSRLAGLAHATVSYY